MKIDKSKLYLDFVKKRKEKGEPFLNTIADEMNISRTTLYRFTTTDKLPSTDNIISICKWIGKPIDNYIIHEID